MPCGRPRPQAAHEAVQPHRSQAQGALAVGTPSTPRHRAVASRDIRERENQRSIKRFILCMPIPLNLATCLVHFSVSHMIRERLPTLRMPSVAGHGLIFGWIAVLIRRTDASGRRASAAPVRCAISGAAR
jgi:hypothetical protein